MKKTLITLAALAMASTAGAIGYDDNAYYTKSYTLSDFTDGVLTLERALDFSSTFEITGSITFGQSHFNDYGTVLIASKADSIYNPSSTNGGFRLYGTAAGGIMSSFNESGSGWDSKLTGYTTDSVLTFTYTYNADTQYAELIFGDDTTTDKRYATLSATDPITQLTTAIGLGEATTGWDINLTITAIPEPTTATLSLLALAGLAARRRRK